MADLFRLLVEVFTYLWPFRPVEEWEQGVYYVMGQSWRVVGPGRWPVLPYFMDVRAVSMVPDPIIGPKQDVTLADGVTVSFTASVITQVVNPDLALNAIHDYQKAVVEIMERNVGTRLQLESREKLGPDDRGRFLNAIRTTIDTETQRFGVKVSSLAFPNFVMNVPTMRLLMEGQPGAL